MGKKVMTIGFIWVAVVFIYIIMAVTMPAANEIIGEASTGLEASANMSNFPGIQEAVESAPVWLWFIPGLVAVVATVVALKRDGG